MFGFKRKKKPAGGFVFKELPEVRDRLKDLTGQAMNIYVGTLIGHLMKIGCETEDAVDRARSQMLTCLQKYVRSEILLARQEHGGELSLAEIMGLSLD